MDIDEALVQELLAKRGTLRRTISAVERDPLSTINHEEEIKELKSILPDFEDLLIRPDLAERGGVTYDGIKNRIKNAVPVETAEVIIKKLDEVIMRFEEHSSVKQLRIEIHNILDNHEA